MKKKIVAIYMSFIVVIGLMVGCSKNKLLEQEVNSESEITVDVTKQKPEEKEDLVHLRLIMYGTTSDRREEYYKNEFDEIWTVSRTIRGDKIKLFKNTK